MFNSHLQLARACRALWTAAAMALLPQGAAWATDHDYEVTIDPPDGFQIIETPFIITATVKPVYPSVPAGARPRPTGTAAIAINQWGDFKPVDAKGRTCMQVDEYKLLNDYNFAWVRYMVDDVLRGYVGGYYHYDPTRVRAKSPRERADSAAQPGQHLTMTSLTTIPSNPVAGPYITFSVQVTDCEDRTQNPQGNVTFCDGDQWLGTIGSLSEGSTNLSFPVDELRLGPSLVTAYFEGNASFAPSADSAVVRVVQSRGRANAEAKPTLECANPPRQKPRSGVHPQPPPGKGTR